MTKCCPCFCLFLVCISFEVTGFADEPGELLTSRANYEKALERATAPLHEKYKQHLERLQGEFTRRNDLDSALAVRKEIEAVEKVMRAGGSLLVSAEEEEPSEKDQLKAWLQDREFRWEGSSVDEVTLKFSDDTVRVEADGKELHETKYEITSATTFRFEWANGEMNTFTLDDRKREFTRFMAGSGSSHGGTVHARSKL